MADYKIRVKEAQVSIFIQKNEADEIVGVFTTNQKAELDQAIKDKLVEEKAIFRNPGWALANHIEGMNIIPDIIMGQRMNYVGLAESQLRYYLKGWTLDIPLEFEKDMSGFERIKNFDQIAGDDGVSTEIINGFMNALREENGRRG